MAIITTSQTEEQQLTFPPTRKPRRVRGKLATTSSVKKTVNRNDSSGSIGSDTSASSSSSSSDTSSVETRAVTKKRTNRRSRNQQKKKQQQSNAAEPTPQEREQYLAMDCEMVGVGDGGVMSALARVTLVDWDGAIVLDEYVRPDRSVTDYRTFVSGITPEHLCRAEGIEACRAKVQAVLDGRILVGHGLKNDLKVLGIRHSWQMIRDTAKYEPFMKVRFDDGILWPRKLRDLVKEKLDIHIQAPGIPHCPAQDAKAAMDLYKSVRNKFEKVMKYKIEKTAQIEQHKVTTTTATTAAAASQ